jgi:hypothetical protein
MNVSCDEEWIASLSSGITSFEPFSFMRITAGYSVDNANYYVAIPHFDRVAAPYFSEDFPQYTPS